jgi:hypothetical protein
MIHFYYLVRFRICVQLLVSQLCEGSAISAVSHFGVLHPVRIAVELLYMYVMFLTIQGAIESGI